MALARATGEIRSAFAMTETAVALSDATNIEYPIERDGDDYVINGRKWYSTIACMHVVGMAAEAQELMCKRGVPRVALQKPLSDQDVWSECIAKSRTLIDQTRLLMLHAAHRINTVGNKAALAGTFC